MSLSRRICIVARLIHGRTCQVAQASQRSYLLLLRRRSEENEGGNLEWEGFMHVSRLHEPENGRLHGVGSRQRDDTGGSCHLDHSFSREREQAGLWVESPALAGSLRWSSRHRRALPLGHGGRREG